MRLAVRPYHQDALLNNTSIHLTIPENNALLGLRRPTVNDYAHPLSEKHRSMYGKLSPIIGSICLVTSLLTMKGEIIIQSCELTIANYRHNLFQMMDFNSTASAYTAPLRSMWNPVYNIPPTQNTRHRPTCQLSIFYNSKPSHRNLRPRRLKPPPFDHRRKILCSLKGFHIRGKRKRHALCVIRQKWKSM